MRNVPEFVQLLIERKYPIEGMRMEVMEQPDSDESYRGIITLTDEKHFTLEWRKRQCMLSCLARLQFRKMITTFLPHFLRLRSNEVMDIDCEHARKLRVLRAIR